MRQKNFLYQKMGGDEQGVRRICGDGLLVQLDSNDCILEVNGDGCKITMSKNCGSVRVIGDGCHVKIGHNVGNIEYTGDGGQVQLGPKSSKENVRYIGDGGRVTFDSDSKTLPKNRKVTPHERNESSAQNHRRSFKQKTSDAMKIEPDVSRNKDGYSSGISPEMENMLNEKKEVERLSGKSDDKRSESIKKPETDAIFRTRIVTTVECEGRPLVRKWFVSPGSVIKCFDGGCAKTASKRSKIQTDAKFSRSS